MGDFAEILRGIYKPLFLLEQLDTDIHIRGAFKILYKLLNIENPIDAQNKYQDLIRTALVAFNETRREIRYLMYPLLMKAVSDHWLPYERFFMERRNRLMAFLGVTEAEQIQSVVMNTSDDEKALEEIAGKEQEEKAEETDAADEDNPEIQEKKAKQDAETKALDRGFQTLDILFPRAGWNHLDEYPDL